MRFRNGAVAFAYVSTLLLRFVDQGKGPPRCSGVPLVP